MATNQTLDFNVELYPKQQEALLSPAQFILYGGAAGSGKSHLARVAAIYACLHISGCQVFIFRRHFDDLNKNHMEGPNSFRVLLQPLVEVGLCEIVEFQIRFTNGSRIHLCHCQYDKNVYNYHGSEIHFLILEEGTQFSEFQVRYLLSRCRIPDTLPIPKKERKNWPRILVPTNPGGLSHGFFKSLFVDPYYKCTTGDDYPIWKMAKLDGGWSAQYIPALLRDNPSIDPEQYAAGLQGLKRKELIDALLEGKWDIPIGAMFPECDERKHVLSPHEVPKHAFKFRTFDWGGSRPFAVLWWYVADGLQEGIPRGALVCYREWYGASQFDMKKGLSLTNKQVADGIREKTPSSEIIQGTITDSLPFQGRGGITIAEEFKECGVILQMGDVSKGSRVTGWQLVRSRLVGINEVPYLYFFRNCRETWRTLTTLQVDMHNPEDAATDGEDHAPDAVSMACKARPKIKDAPVLQKDWREERPTWGHLIEKHIEAKQNETYLH